jgi:hypothetical protein
MEMEESAAIDSIFPSDSPRPGEAVKVTANCCRLSQPKALGLLSNWTSTTLRVQVPRQPEAA